MEYWQTKVPPSSHMAHSDVDGVARGGIRVRARRRTDFRTRFWLAQSGC